MADKFYSFFRKVGGVLNVYTPIQKVPETPIAETTLSYTSPGTYNLVVPANVIRLEVKVYGAGGGGGASEGNGDQHAGGSAGSGGWITLTLEVTPGETITLNVGKGGLRGYWRFNSTWYIPNDATTNGAPYGGNGGNSSVYKGATPVVTVTGGKGGGAAYGDGANGIGGDCGIPNGVRGQTSAYPRNDYPPTPGGNNATGYGKGGDGSGNVPFTLPTNGGDGAVVVTYGGRLQNTNNKFYAMIRGGQ